MMRMVRIKFGNQLGDHYGLAPMHHPTRGALHSRVAGGEDGLGTYLQAMGRYRVGAKCVQDAEDEEELEAIVVKERQRNRGHQIGKPSYDSSFTYKIPNHRVPTNAFPSVSFESDSSA